MERQAQLEKLGFTPEEVEEIVTALQREWQRIGGDIIMCNEGQPVDREDALEAV